MILEEIWTTSVSKYKIQQKKQEWLSFLELVQKENPVNILEIGCYDGGSTWGLSNLCKNMITIDANNPSRFDVKDMMSICNYTYIGQSSHNDSLVTTVKTKLSVVDVLFIDGDHSYEGSLQDFKMYSPLVKHGGLVAFHDIVDSSEHRRMNCYVNKSFTEVKKSTPGETWEFIFDNRGKSYTFEESFEKSDIISWGGIGVKRINL